MTMTSADGIAQGVAPLPLKNYRRIAVKIGSALLVDRTRGLKREWLQSLADDIGALAAEGAEILVVSSGAIALGRTILGLGRKALKLEESQAAAAVGQIALAGAWAEALARHGLKSGQILLTLGDTEERRRYLNARATISTLLKMQAVPVINENDTVATSEIRYGDNDRLAARVATMMGADLLVLLSDIDGLYTAPPARDPAARFIPLVERITPDIEAMAGAAACAPSSTPARSPPRRARPWSSPPARGFRRSGRSSAASASRCSGPAPIRSRATRPGSPASWSRAGG